MSSSPSHARSRAPSLALLTSNFHPSPPGSAIRANGSAHDNDEAATLAAADDSNALTPSTSAPTPPFSPETELVRLQEELDSQAAVAHGAANFLAMLDPGAGGAGGVDGATAELREQVERELAGANEKSQHIIQQINRLNSTLIRVDSEPRLL